MGIRRAWVMICSAVTFGIALTLIVAVMVGEGYADLLPRPVTGPGNPIVDPPPNAHSAPATATVSVTYDEPIDPATVSTRTFAVHAMQTGLLTQTYSVEGGTIRLMPIQRFKPGELVQASATTDTLNTSGVEPLQPTVWQFWAAATGGTGIFTDGGQTLGLSMTMAVDLGDLDGDGDLDAFAGNGWDFNRVWRNDGTGTFADSGQTLGMSTTKAVALGDLDGDDDLDAFIGNSGWPGEANQVWWNDGNGAFVDTGQTLGISDTLAVALGDLDGDGDLDAFVGNRGSWPYYQPNQVWLNDGSGLFIDSGQTLAISPTTAVALGDLDGDGDLDVFVGNWGGSNRVWLNDGTAFFTNSGQVLGESDTSAVALGDLDGDEDLDAFVGNVGQSNRIWLNDGTGMFTDSGHMLGESDTSAVALGDLDGDEDLDAFVGNGDQPNRVWVNGGVGVFADSGQKLGLECTYSVALGDLDGDGDLDVFVGNAGEGTPNAVWVNNKHWPQARDDGFAVPVNSSANPIDVLANDWDADGDALALVGLGVPDQGGTAAVRDTTVISYTPREGYAGAEVFTYTISDPGGLTDTATVTVDVGGTNHPPTARDDTVMTDEDVVVVIDVLANDHDPDGHDLSVSAVSAPAGGTAVIVGGQVRYSPLPDLYGQDAFTYIASDGWLTDTATVTVTVNAVEDGPTLDLILDVTTHEDAPTRTLALTGITSGAFNEDQILTVTARTAVNPGLVPDPTVVYSSPNLSGILSFAPVADAFGSAQIEVIVSDGISQTMRSFWITVQPVNDPPTLNLLSDLTIEEDAPTQTVSFVGVGYGPNNEHEQRSDLAITAASTSPLIPHPTVDYDNGPGRYTHGSLSFAPLAEAYGVATIVVTVTDGLSETVRSFQVTVTPVNDAPTLDPIADLMIKEDAGLQTVDLTGMGPGPLETQLIAVTAASTDTWLLPHPAVNYQSPDATGTLTFASQPDRFGTARVVVTVTDGLSRTARSFQVTVNPVNDPPTLDPLPDLEIGQGAGPQTVDLTGITAGPLETQALSVTAASDNAALISHPVVTYTSPNGSGALGFMPLPDRWGTAVIAVTVTDGLAETVRSFQVTVGALFKALTTDPAGHALGVPRKADIAAQFTRPPDGASVDTTTFAVHGRQTGVYQGAYAVAGDQAIFDPSSRLKPGEDVMVTLSQGLRSAEGMPLLASHTWQFWAATRGGVGIFDVAETHEIYPALATRYLWDYLSVLPQSVLDTQAVALGDLDDDGDLDAYVVRNGARSTAWFNDGTGAFSDSGQNLGQASSWAAALGDLDNDGDLDAFVGNYRAGDTVWSNDGTGTFSDSGQSLGDFDTYAVALGDVDGDGDLDAITGSDLGQPNHVWLNDGSGTFGSPSSGYRLGFADARAVALGDLDNDGDLDAFLGSAGGWANRVWLNDGGEFHDSGQRLGASDSHAVALGDLDGDGDVDAFVGNMNGESDEIWLNDHGTFANSGQALGDGATWAVALGDVDGDRDLDAFTGQVAYGLVSNNSNRVWRNDGNGAFLDDGQRLAAFDSVALALGDVDGDGDLDAFVGNSNGLWQPNVVYRNRTPFVLVDATQGGTLSHGDAQGGETLVHIPAGAVGAPTEFRYAPEGKLSTASTGSTMMSHPFGLEAYRDGDLVPDLGLMVPMTIVLRYSDAVVEGWDETSLELRQRDGGVWADEAITLLAHDVARNRLTVQAMRTARFALFGQRAHTAFLPLVAKDR